MKNMIFFIPVSQYYKHKLKSFYSSALTDAEKECDALKSGLEIITKIKNLQEEKRMAMRYTGALNYHRQNAMIKRLFYW